MKDEKTGANPPLSSADRLRMLQTLNALPQAQFEQLLFAMEIPAGFIPPSSASQGIRSAQLLRWAEGPTGSGLHELEQILSEMVGTSSRFETTTFSVTRRVEEDLTEEELQAIVKLLRSKGKDGSIEISIKEDYEQMP